VFANSSTFSFAKLGTPHWPRLPRGYPKGRARCRPDGSPRCSVRLIERYLTLRHPLLHLAHFAFLDAHVLGDQFRLRARSLRLEAFGLLSQIEKQLSLRLRRADFHEPQLLIR